MDRQAVMSLHLVAQIQACKESLVLPGIDLKQENTTYIVNYSCSCRGSPSYAIDISVYCHYIACVFNVHTLAGPSSKTNDCVVYV